jgi:hypothetical protein
MIRSAVSKVMWAGRATVFLVGLAVIMAMVLGVASMALGANGKPFILGKMNTASAVSKLVKSGVGPALQLNVGSGPPLGVNSSTKVANLNADKVDGQEAATLLPGGELPSGRTLRGNYGIYDVAPENSVAWASDSISFGYRLPSEPTVRIIHTSGSGAGTPLVPERQAPPKLPPVTSASTKKKVSTY